MNTRMGHRLTMESGCRGGKVLRAGTHPYTYVCMGVRMSEFGVNTLKVNQ